MTFDELILQQERQKKILEDTDRYLTEKPYLNHPDFIRIREERKNGTLDPDTFHDRITTIMFESPVLE